MARSHSKVTKKSRAGKPATSKRMAADSHGAILQLNDPAVRLIAAKRAADAHHLAAIYLQYDTERETVERCTKACYAAIDVAWELATTPPATLEGVAAVLRFANQVEDEGNEWPDTDTIGREGWHYQLRATMAAAIETIIRSRQQPAA